MTRQFHGRNEILAFAQSCVVPLHIHGRKPAHTEAWILSRYLLACADAGLLKYPITAIHAEESRSPDYILVEPAGARTGLEITEASTCEFHRELINNERGIDNHYELRPGWIGDQPEHEWAALAFDTIRTKAAKLACGSWDPADAYDLLLYDNGPAPVFDLTNAQGFLRAQLSGFQSGFRSISMITAGGTQLLHDVAGEGRTLSIAVA